MAAFNINHQCMGLRRQADGSSVRCSTRGSFMALIGFSDFFCLDHLQFESKLDRETRDTLVGIRNLNPEITST